MVDEQSFEQDQPIRETKQERRETRRARQKAKMTHHGKGLARVYRDAVSKRARVIKAPKG